MDELTAKQISTAKGNGFLYNRGTREFSGRIITKNGLLTAKQMEVLSAAAKKFGNGTMAFTVRLSVELPGIDYDDIESFKEFVEKENMKIGGTGKRVRPIVACKGTTCVFGLYDTQDIAAQMYQRFFEGYKNIVLPHKFKITVGGCPNNCTKPDLNDIGIVGRRTFNINYDDCKGCKKCGMVNECPMKAATIVDGKINIDTAICNNCGRCIEKCHFKIAVADKNMCKIYIGGRWGKKIRIGTPLTPLFTINEALDITEKAILLFKSKGIYGERFGETVERLGFIEVENLLISNDLLIDKAKYLL